MARTKLAVSLWWFPPRCRGRRSATPTISRCPASAQEAATYETADLAINVVSWALALLPIVVLLALLAVRHWKTTQAAPIGMFVQPRRRCWRFSAALLLSFPAGAGRVTVGSREGCRHRPADRSEPGFVELTFPMRCPAAAVVLR